MMYATPHKSSSHNGSTTLRQTPSSALSSRSSSTSSSSSSSPPSISTPSSSSPTLQSLRLTSPRKRIIRPLHHSNHHNTQYSLSSECLRLLTKSNKLLLGIASLLVTWLLTASPYERMALEKLTRNYDIPNGYYDHSFSLQQQQQHSNNPLIRAKRGLPDNLLLLKSSSSSNSHKKNHNLRQRTAKEEEENKVPDVDVTPPSRLRLSPEPFLPTAQTQVHFLADATTPDRTSKFILDGLERSSYLEITAISIAQLHATERQLASLQVFERKSELPLLYVVDWGSMDRDCGLLHTMLQKTSISRSDSILLMDFSASHRHTKCAFLDDYKTKYTKRSVVEKRYYDMTFNWIYPGQLMENEGGDVVHFAPLVLRESFVDLMHNVTTSKVQPLERTNDLLFNWKPGDNSHFGFLRRLVADKVQSLGANVTSFAGSDQGYVEAMLRSKIIVLAQRDEWEGHYRLFEAMASGALVLTDPILAMPPHFQNGTNLVVYHNLEELKRYIRYYSSDKRTKKRLEIAQNGYATVMGRHRTWHRMEEIVFGTALTSVDQLDGQAPTKQERPDLTLVEHS
ncbi:unnamed protein product [Cylindrotheca closterium]|uniref:Spore protein YkvP/CgeB glycosyl transferase-like domain-containing protein n=1 Tax=Cylindrotheca closterium TaxID=2856 RepID=A0AAD2CF30_9STRA|nr:unnamed protein product [Cylindrotheca closterium]